VAASAILVCSSFAQSTSSTATTPPSKHKPVSRSTKPKTTTSAKTKSSHATSARTSSKKGKHSKKVRGQQKIDSERTHQIQEALIQRHYLNGQATGKWDAPTEDALRRFQADNGWQNKTVPDSRALIKLGLGPNHDHLLNPESAMTTTPDAPQSSKTPVSTPSGPSPTESQPQR
jgi:putative peptidoglycan binding protein